MDLLIPPFSYRTVLPTLSEGGRGGRLSCSFCQSVKSHCNVEAYLSIPSKKSPPPHTSPTRPQPFIPPVYQVPYSPQDTHLDSGKNKSSEKISYNFDIAIFCREYIKEK